MAEKKSNDKKRNWAFLMYPDSAPENWKDILQLSGLQCSVSPLHDSDLNADETQKKPHWHVILAYSGPTSYNVVLKFTASLNATIPQALEQVKGYYRYFTHKDNPEKTQYDEADIININGFSIRDFVEMTKSEITAIKRDIMRYIEQNDIREYSDLLIGLDKEDLHDMWEVAANNTIFADAYCRSRRHKLEKGMPQLKECVK
jgi:hypothetical protein